MSNEKPARAAAHRATGPSYSKPPYMLTGDEVLRELDIHGDHGLTDEAAAQRLEQYGRNELEGSGGVHAWKVCHYSVFL